MPVETTTSRHLLYRLDCRTILTKHTMPLEYPKLTHHAITIGFFPILCNTVSAFYHIRKDNAQCIFALVSQHICIPMIFGPTWQLFSTTEKKEFLFNLCHLTNHKDFWNTARLYVDAWNNVLIRWIRSVTDVAVMFFSWHFLPLADINRSLRI